MQFFSVGMSSRKKNHTSVIFLWGTLDKKKDNLGYEGKINLNRKDNPD